MGRPAAFGDFPRDRNGRSQPCRRACFPAPPSAAVRDLSARPSAAHSKDLGEPYRGQALIRLLQQPHGLQPDTQGKLRGVQRRVCRHRELEPAIAAGTLIKTRLGAPLAGIAAGKRKRAFVSAGGADPAIRPHHAFQQPTAMLLIPEGHDHLFNGPDAGKRGKHRFRHSHPFAACPKNPMKHRIQQGDCCLWLIKPSYEFELRLFRPRQVACCCLAIDEFSSGACLFSFDQATLTEKKCAAVTWAYPPGRDAARSARLLCAKRPGPVSNRPRPGKGPWTRPSRSHPRMIWHSNVPAADQRKAHQTPIDLVNRKAYWQ